MLERVDTSFTCGIDTAIAVSNTNINSATNTGIPCLLTICGVERQYSIFIITTDKNGISCQRDSTKE